MNEATLSGLLTALEALQEQIVLDRRHCYRIQKQPRAGVTTAIKVMDAPALDNWKVKVQVEGTALAAFQNPPQPNEPPEFYVARLLAIAKEQYEHERIADAAADIGTQVHALIEAEIGTQLGKPTVQPTVVDEALFAFAGWKEWAKRVSLRPLMAEGRLHHPTFDYCGTFDLLALVNSELSLLDWKPQARIYDERRLQSAAYREALHAMGWPPIRGYIVGMPRDGGEIEMLELERDVTVPFNAFLNCLSLYNWKRDLARAERKAKAA